MTYPIQVDLIEPNRSEIRFCFTIARETKKDFNIVNPHGNQSSSVELNAFRQILSRMQAIDHRTNCILNSKILPEPLCFAMFIDIVGSRALSRKLK